MHEASVTFLGFGLSPHEPAIGIILSAVYAQVLTLDPESHKLTFDNNRSRGKGGAVYVSESVTVNENVTFRNNGADRTQ